MPRTNTLYSRITFAAPRLVWQLELQYKIYSEAGRCREHADEFVLHWSCFVGRLSMYVGPSVLSSWLVHKVTMHWTISNPISSWLMIAVKDVFEPQWRQAREGDNNSQVWNYIYPFRRWIASVVQPWDNAEDRKCRAKSHAKQRSVDNDAEHAPRRTSYNFGHSVDNILGNGFHMILTAR